MKIKPRQHIKLITESRSGLKVPLYVSVVDIIDGKIIVCHGVGNLFEITEDEVVAIVKPPEHRWETWTTIEQLKEEEK